MNDYADILDQFEPITLDEIGSIKDSVSLLHRHDTKFVLPRAKLSTLLRALTTTYRILEIKQHRVLSYKNLYFDTADHWFYRQHHNRKLNRYKLRYRHYVETHAHYWEIKFKNNKRKTIKERVKQDQPVTALTDDIKQTSKRLCARELGVELDQIQPIIWITFSRTTLASTDLHERITIDTSIAYESMDGRTEDLADIAVAELKQGRRSLRSPFVQAAKLQKIYPRTFSKYCTGVALLENPAKVGRFKRRIIHLQQLRGG